MLVQNSAHIQLRCSCVPVLSVNDNEVIVPLKTQNALRIEKVLFVHGVKTYSGNGSIPPLILNFVTRRL